MARRSGDVMLQLTVSREERALIQARAAGKGLQVGAYVRLALNSLALEEDEEAALIDERQIGRPPRSGPVEGRACPRR